MRLSRTQTLLAGGLILWGGAKAVDGATITSLTYQVTVDTSSLAGLQGELTFQAQLIDNGGRVGANQIQISNLSGVGANQTDTPLSSGVETSTSLDDFTLVPEGGITYSQMVVDFSSYTSQMSFQLTLTGLDFLSENQNSYGSYFALIMDAWEPDPFNPGGYDDEQVLFDDLNDTMGVTTGSTGDVIDNNPAATVTPVTVPEPASAMLALPLLALSLRRRKRLPNVEEK